MRVTEIHWVLVKVSPIVAKDCNNRGDKLNEEEECIFNACTASPPVSLKCSSARETHFNPTMNKDAAALASAGCLSQP